jgi:biopolymer transport protein ExbB
MSSRKKMWICLALLLGAGFASTMPARAAGSLDELLEQTRSARQREADANTQREQRFLTQRNQQAALLAEAKGALAAQRARGASLAAAYDSNEKKLAELTTQLDAKAGNLGEMFGVVRQVANDFSSVVHNSLISAQYPDREDFIVKLSQAKALPSMPDLERFWFELQREMTESGRVARFQAKIVTPEGKPADAAVVRVGSFNATSSGR